MDVLEEVPLAEDDDVSLDMVASTPISTDLSVSSQSESSNKKSGKRIIIVLIILYSYILLISDLS